MAGIFMSALLSRHSIAYIARQRATIALHRLSIYRMAQNGDHGIFILRNSTDTVVATSAPLNRMSGKSMLKNKSSQIARIRMSSSVGYLRNERIIAHVIVECVSNMKGRRESS